MKIKYDKKVDAVYIDLAKGTWGLSRMLSDSLVVGATKQRKVLGIEILDASENISAFDPKNTKFTLQSV